MANTSGQCERCAGLRSPLEPCIRVEGQASCRLCKRVHRVCSFCTPRTKKKAGDTHGRPSGERRRAGTEELEDQPMYRLGPRVAEPGPSRMRGGISHVDRRFVSMMRVDLRRALAAAEKQVEDIRAMLEQWEWLDED